MTEQVAVVVNRVAVTLSPYPPSFGSNPYAYGAALAALLSIGVFAVLIVSWMLRDLWRDRWIDHPTSLVFLFRAMVMFAATAASVRCWPEVIYMTLYGDRTADPQLLAYVLMFKRMMDVVALPLVSAWMGILISIYPFVVLVLRSSPGFNDRIDPTSAWPRLARPALIFGLVVVIASLMAVAKGYGIQG